jgi:hypothetical protein
MGVPLDRDPEGELAGILRVASLRAAYSLETAKRLLRGKYRKLYAGCAYVWAVRSVEILFEEFMLLPYFLDQTGGDWKAARKKASRTFGSANWTKALETINGAYGPLDPMLTEDGEDIWQIWSTRVVARRGQIVHGETECDLSEAKTIVQWAKQIAVQLKMRLIVGQKHPLADIFMAILGQARASSGDPGVEG